MEGAWGLLTSNPTGVWSGVFLGSGDFIGLPLSHQLRRDSQVAREPRPRKDGLRKPTFELGSRRRVRSRVGSIVRSEPGPRAQAAPAIPVRLARQPDPPHTPQP